MTHVEEREAVSDSLYIITTLVILEIISRAPWRPAAISFHRTLCVIYVPDNLGFSLEDEESSSAET